MAVSEDHFLPRFSRNAFGPWGIRQQLPFGLFISCYHDSYIFWRLVQFPLSIPSGSAVKNPLAMQELQEMRLDPCVRKIPWRTMATHSSILAWRISWTEEPSGLLSIGSQRVGLDRRTWRAHTCSSPGITGAGQCLSNQRKTWEALLCILRLLSTSGPEPLGFRVFMVPTSMTNTS